MAWPPSRNSRSHSDWNGRSAHPDSHRSMSYRDFYSVHNLGRMSSRERDDIRRRSHGRLQNPDVTPRERSGLRATMDNIHASSHDDRRRNRQAATNDLTDSFAGLNMRSRRAGRGVYFEDELPTAPEPPRQWNRNSEYYRGRYDAYNQHNRSRDPSRRSSGWQQDHSDAYHYIHGERPRRHTTSGQHNPRDYADRNLRFCTSNSRHHDPSDSFMDRMRRWF